MLIRPTLLQIGCTVLLVVIIAPALVSQGSPTSAVWIAASGAWNVAGNWSCGSSLPLGCLPTSTRAASISNAGTATLTTGGTAQSLTISLGGLNIANGSLQSGVIQVGGRGNSHVAITGTGTVDSAGVFLLGGGTSTVSGGGRWTNTFMEVGATGPGALTIETGGQMNSPAGLFVGAFGGSGTLTIQSGGIVASGLTTIGSTSGSSGAVTVMNAGSALLASNLHVGIDAHGTLSIKDKGLVSVTDSAAIASTAGVIGSATIDGVGSQLTVPNDLVIGVNGGTGLLAVKNGALVAAGRSLSLGSTGSLTVTAGGTVNAKAAFAKGTVVIDGGSFTTADGYVLSGGTTKLVDSGSLTAPVVSISGGLLFGSGAISGPTVVEPGGAMAPGDAPSTGVLNFATGPLIIRGRLTTLLTSNGISSAQVAGNISLDTTSSILEIAQSPDYVPAIGTTHVVLTGASPVSGQFGQIVNPAFDGGAKLWYVGYNFQGNNVTLIAGTPKVFVIDPGHGQILQNGVLTYQRPPSPTLGLREDNLTLLIGLAAADALTKQGHTVHLTRQTATAFNATPDCADPCIIDLVKRRQFAEALDADVLVSVHTNAEPTSAGTAHGTEAWYRYGTHDSPALASALLDAVAPLTGTSRGVFKGQLAVLSSSMSSALIEVAFHTNSVLVPGQIRTDEVSLSMTNFRSAAAMAVARAITGFIALTF